MLNDLDLHLVTPDGKEINYNNRTWNGGYLDYDKNVAGKAKTRTPIENINGIMMSRKVFIKYI